MSSTESNLRVTFLSRTRYQDSKSDLQGKAMTREIVINSDESLKTAIKEITDIYNKSKYIRVKMTTGRQRTITQNASLHLYCQLLADALNEAGYP